MSQTVYAVGDGDKRAAVVQILRERNLKQVIVFVNTKIGASRLARHLESDGINAVAIHGDRSQAERLKALDDFKGGRIEALVATDVAARGLDIAELPAVINFDVPHNAEDYVHRIGRTGRAGASGDAISLMAPSEERLVADIERLMKKTLVRETLAVRARPPRVHSSAPATPVGVRRAPREDDWFSKPYEPSAASAAVALEDTAATAAPVRAKQSVGALLGGVRKKA